MWLRWATLALAAVAAVASAGKAPAQPALRDDGRLARVQRYKDFVSQVSDRELTALERALDAKLAESGSRTQRTLLQAPAATDPDGRDPEYKSTEGGQVLGRPGEEPGLEGYMPPLGYEDLSPYCNQILNAWLSKCAFKHKMELSLRKSARKKYGPDSPLRFVDEILTLN